MEHRQQIPDEEQSEPVAVTTQEAVDGYREKALRIASVEQVELGNITEMSITVGKTIELLWWTVAEQSRWMEPEESQSLDSCQALAREDSPQHLGRDNQGR